jgi:hypothetical protein
MESKHNSQSNRNSDTANRLFKVRLISKNDKFGPLYSFADKETPEKLDSTSTLG